MAKVSLNTVKATLYLIRHAESEFNSSGIIQGHLDTNLSKTGLEQAVCLGKYLRNIKFDYAYTSDLERAYRTGFIMIEQNEICNNLNLIKEKLLRERNFGEFQGKAKSLMIEEARKLNLELCDYVPNGAETYADINLRWKLFFENMCRDLLKSNEPEISVLIFSHGQFLKENIKYMTREYKLEFLYDKQELEKSPPNTSYSKLYLELDKNYLNSVKELKDSILNFKCESFNLKDHLAIVTDNLSDM